MNGIGMNLTPLTGILGGRGEIRTHGGLAPTTVFKTVALNRSATLPNKSLRARIIPKNIRLAHLVINNILTGEKHICIAELSEVSDAHRV